MERRRFTGPERTSSTSLARWVALLVVVQCVLAALLAVIIYQDSRSRAKPGFPADYYALLLTSGHVLYGRLDPASNACYVLTDAYYLRSQKSGVMKRIEESSVRWPR